MVAQVGLASSLRVVGRLYGVKHRKAADAAAVVMGVIVDVSVLVIFRS